MPYTSQRERDASFKMRSSLTRFQTHSLSHGKPFCQEESELLWLGTSLNVFLNSLMRVPGGLRELEYLSRFTQGSLLTVEVG